MKRRTSIAIALASLLAMGAIAQEKTTPRVFAEFQSYRECDLARFERNFVSSLEYPADCIIEAGLAQVAMLKLAQPQTECNKLRRRVDELAIHGESPAIRYKAYLTSMVFDHPDLFVYEKYGEYESGEQLFTALAQRLEKEALATK